MSRGTGYKRGERHHRARCPNTVVDRAKLLCSRGYSYGEAATLIAEETGHAPSWRTIADWVRGDTRAAA